MIPPPFSELSGKENSILEEDSNAGADHSEKGAN